MARVVGIDPGLNGALALLEGAKLTDLTDMPTHAKRVNGRLVAETLMRWDPDYVVIEDVHSMPKQGVASSFLFGLNTGIVIGAVQACGLPMIKISSLRIGSSDLASSRCSATLRRPLMLNWTTGTSSSGYIRRNTLQAP